MCEAIYPLPPYVLIVWCLVKHRDNFSSIMILNQLAYMCENRYGGNDTVGYLVAIYFNSLAQTTENAYREKL
jgi:hypothetical protein